MSFVKLLKTFFARCLRYRLNLSLLVFIAAFLTCLPSTLPASAHSAQTAHSSHIDTVSTCRGDPIVVMSNHVVLRLQVQIDRPDASTVGHVIYYLHGPIGVRVVSVEPLQDAFYGKEQFQYMADLHTDTYTVYTKLFTSDNSMNVTGYMLLTDSARQVDVSNFADGHPNNDIVITYTY